MTDTQAASRDARRKMMLEDPVARVIPLLAVPLMIAMLIDSVYNMTDTYFVSRLGMAATAAVGVNDSLMQLIRALAMGFGIGASSYISRLLGAKEYDKASRVGSTSLLTAFGVISALSVIAYLFMDPLVTLLGATPNVKPYSVQYGSWILVSAPFTVGTVILSQLLRSEGNTTYSMIGLVSGCAVNMFLDPLFINVFGMGIAGAAIATGISKACSYLILFLPYLRGKTLVELKFRLFTPKVSIYGEIVTMGVPTFLKSSLLALSIIVINNVAGMFGDSALAAVSVANKCTKLTGAAMIGLGQGFQPLVGYCWGAGRYRRVRKAFWTCSAMGVAAGVVLGAVMAALAPQMIRIFAATDDAEMIRIGSLMIVTQCVTMAFHVWAIVVNSLYQALGRPLGSTVLGLSRQLICLIPALIILPKLFGINGLASAQAVADLLTLGIAIPMVVSFMRGLKPLEAGEGYAEENRRLQLRPKQVKI